MLNKIGKKLGYKEGGFTIIEVLIVLAVAGLIMAIVLIAIPQLQRNQRNTARREVVNRIKTEIDAYAGNNNGRVPEDDADLDSVYERYLGCGTAADASDNSTLGSCEVNIEDPSTGNPYTFATATGTAGPIDQIGTLGEGEYINGFSCDGETLVDEGTSTRVYAMYVDLEGGAVYCVDNK